MPANSSYDATDQQEYVVLDILSKVFKLDEEEICLNEEKQKQLTKHAKGFWMLEGMIRCLNYYFQDKSDYEPHLEHIYDLLETTLNTGHFSEVPEVYRLLFSVCCLIQSFVLWRNDCLEEALNKCDEGLLKGYELDENVLGELGEVLADQMGVMEKIEFSSNLSHNPPKPLSKSRKIPVLHLPSLETFYTNAFLPETPVIIRDLLPKMPCYEKWSFEYLYNKCAHRMVPVELGNKYTDEDWRQILMPFGQFFRNFVVNEESAEEPGYMAQHRLLDQVPSLRKDIVIPDYCSLAMGKEPENINCFIGPSSTVSPLHTDPRHNLFFQVRGRKFVRLINPNQKDKIYLFEDFLRSNSSQVDVEHPDYEKHPKFEDVIVEDFVMQQGDGLYIPQGYFHHIRALEPSISMSIWFGDSKKGDKEDKE